MGLCPERRRREQLLLGLIFLLALGLRGVHAWGQWQSNPLFLAPSMDELKHHGWAQQIASGEGLGPRPFFRAPLYYLLLGVLYKAAGANVPLARLLGCFLGAVTCVLIALLGRALAGSRAGVIAGLIAALYWPFIHFDQLLLSAGLETFLGVLLLLLLLAAARRGAWWLHVAAGAVWGLAVITRPTIITFAPAIALWAWFGERLLQPDRSDSPPRSRRVRNLLLLGAAAATTIAPVTLRNRLVGGEWVLVATNGGLNFFIGNNARADGVSAIVPGTRADWDGGYEDTHAIAQRELGPRLGRPVTEGEVSGYWYGKAREWLRSDPAGALRLTFRKLALFWTPVEIPNNNAVWFFARQSPLAWAYRIGFPVVAVLGIAGLTLLPRPAWRAWCLPVAYFLIGMLTVVAFFVVDRYRMPMIPVLMVAAGAGLACLPELWSQRRFRRLSVAVAAGAAMICVELACRPGLVFWPQGKLFWEQEEARGERALGDYALELVQKRPEMRAEALKHYRAAAAILPTWAETQLLIGTTLMRSPVPAEVEGAGTALERAVQLRPPYADAHRFYGEWLVLHDRAREAIEQYRQVAQLQPWGSGYQEALLGLGSLLEHEGRSTEAGEWLLRSLGNDPHDELAVEYLTETARSLRRKGQGAEAIALLEHGLPLAQDPGPMLRELRSAYRESGETAKAVAIDVRLRARGEKTRSSPATDAPPP
jgi:Tfp pilus assembly protein PilF